MLGAKINQKSTKKGSQQDKASWHRFFIDVGGFWTPSWAKLAPKIQQKSMQKNHPKKEALKKAS